MRKIRCDETRPQCNKCASTGRSCGGYELAQEPHNGFQSRRPLLAAASGPPGTSPHLVRFNYQPRNISFTDYERHAFDFRLECAPALEDDRPGREWVRFALLFASEEAVFYAITAFAVVGRNVALTTHHALAPPTAIGEQVEALQQFSKATTFVRNYINHKALRGAGTEPVLLCCIMFVAFEMLRGKQDNAISHLRIGRRILEEQLGGFVTPTSLSQSSGCSLQRAFLELIATWDPGKPDGIVTGRNEAILDQDCQTTSPRAAAKLPSIFASLAQARACLDAINNASNTVQHRLLKVAESHLFETDRTNLRPAVRLCMAHCLGKRVDLSHNTELLTEVHALVRAHDSWLDAASHMKEDRCHRQHQSLSLLTIRHFFSSLTLKMCLAPKEAMWDRFETDFTYMLDLTEYFLKVPLLSSTVRLEPPTTLFRKSYSIERGIFPTLALIALKCRHPAIRRRAIEVLHKSNRQEGLVSGDGIAFFAESIMNIEEAHAHHSRRSFCDSVHMISSHDKKAPLPESARFSDVVVSGESRVCTRVVCGRFAHERSGGLEILEYLGTGYPMTFQLQNQFVTECYLKPSAVDTF